eukprot:403355225
MLSNKILLPIVVVLSMTIGSTYQAITFGQVPECISLNKTSDMEEAVFYTIDADEYNAKESAYNSSHRNLTHIGFNKAYLVSMFVQSGETRECFYVVDKPSSLNFTNRFRLQTFRDSGSAKVYSVSGTKCQTVSQNGEDIVLNKLYTPTVVSNDNQTISHFGNNNSNPIATQTGVVNNNCAYLFHLTLKEKTFDPTEYEMYEYLVNYDSTSQTQAVSESFRLLYSAYSTFAVISLLVVNTIF